MQSTPSHLHRERGARRRIAPRQFAPLRLPMMNSEKKMGTESNSEDAM